MDKSKETISIGGTEDDLTPEKNWNKLNQGVCSKVNRRQEHGRTTKEKMDRRGPA